MTLTPFPNQVIDAQAEMALSSEGFTEIDVQTMKTIMERETLNCRETVVFKAAVAWAQAECQRKGIELSGRDRCRLKRDNINSVICLQKLNFSQKLRKLIQKH